MCVCVYTVHTHLLPLILLPRYPLAKNLPSCHSSHRSPYAPSPRHLRSWLSPGGGGCVVLCGGVIVVSCVVLFVLCVCVCDLFLFLQHRSPPFTLQTKDKSSKEYQRMTWEYTYIYINPSVSFISPFSNFHPLDQRQVVQGVPAHDLGGAQEVHQRAGQQGQHLQHQGHRGRVAADKRDPRSGTASPIAHEGPGIYTYIYIYI